jgi:hypothetical protein
MGICMKSFRRLRVGEVIKNGDIWVRNGEFYGNVWSAIGDRFDPKAQVSFVYRPLPAKKVERWTVYKPAGVNSTAAEWWTIGDKAHGERARVWSLKDARLICRAVSALGEK